MNKRFLTETEVAERTRISLGTLRRCASRIGGRTTTSLARSSATQKMNFSSGRKLNREAGQSRKDRARF